MFDIEYVKNHIEDFEKGWFIDCRFINRFIDFLPTEEWEKFGFEYTGEEEYTPIEWNEENILKQLKRDTIFGYEKAECERGISSELMAMVVNAWCKVLQNDLNLEGADGYYHIEQFKVVAAYYGWTEDMINGNYEGV